MPPSDAPKALYDYDYTSDDTDAKFEIFEIETGVIVDWANTHEQAARLVVFYTDKKRKVTA